MAARFKLRDEVAQQMENGSIWLGEIIGGYRTPLGTEGYVCWTAGDDALGFIWFGDPDRLRLIKSPNRKVTDALESNPLG